MTLCYALAVAACPIALLIGDLAAAEHYVEMLLDHSARHGLARWRAFRRSYQGVLLIGRGDFVTGSRLLRAAFHDAQEVRSAPRFMPFIGEAAEALGGVAQIANALAEIDEAVDCSEHAEERWRVAELLRSRASSFCCRVRPEPRRRARIISGRRSSGRAGKASCPGNCAPPRALPGCCAQLGPFRRCVGPPRAGTRPVYRSSKPSI
jgi:hypothetical protein